MAPEVLVVVARERVELVERVPVAVHADPAAEEERELQVVAVERLLLVERELEAGAHARHLGEITKCHTRGTTEI